MTKHIWNADTYAKFLTARTRPARDLLAAVPQDAAPAVIYDLGCGPGNSTVLLQQRWPHATIIGLDSSSTMLEAARKDYPEIDFIEGNIEHFAPDEQIDLLFANASLHWLEDHPILFSKLTQTLNPGGTLAVQMPNNFHLPAHQITIDLLQSRETWQPLLNTLQYGALTAPRFELANYYDILSNVGLTNILLWETTYYQEMPNSEAIFEWTKGTGLRPVLSAIDPADKDEFIDLYLKAIDKAYPKQANGKVLFPFRRVFMVGMR
ncbi:MAG: trans-aconitate methyltransferase [Legionellales bacterium]|nr:trans-aconitate methyltransferase [Legionellales bacterium]|tara:strand:+ start:715 stop:1506 length:792 start_codon:yes stop_codon:yes gene_type:complete